MSVARRVVRRWARRARLIGLVAILAASAWGPLWHIHAEADTDAGATAETASFEPCAGRPEHSKSPTPDRHDVGGCATCKMLLAGSEFGGAGRTPELVCICLPPAANRAPHAELLRAARHGLLLARGPPPLA